MKTDRERDIIIEKINILKDKQAQELAILKDQFHETYESFKPLNVLKSTFHDITSTPEIKGDLVNGALNLAT